MKKILKWVAIIFGGLFLLGFIGNLLKSPEQKAADREAQAEIQAQRRVEAEQKKVDEIAVLPTVSAVDLAREYDANTLAADQKYKGQKFKVAGKVTNINTDMLGNPYITMGGSNPFMQPQFSFSKEHAGALAQIKKGDKLVLLCEGKGDVAKTPMSGNCQILQ